MSAAEMLSYIEHCTPEERLDFQVVMQCAPVLKHVKASNLLTVNAGEWQQVRKRLRDSRIICTLLYANGEREVVFCYRYERLETHLMRPEVREFLRELGYESGERYGVAAVMKRLRRRYQQYAGAGQAFPHELGVLLEYPAEDVREFIARKGKDYLISGYWKVYHDVDGAQKQFGMYDLAKEQALRELMSGKSLSQIAR